MKVLPRGLLLIPIALASGTASAQTSSIPEAATDVNPKYMRPCGFWRLDSTSFDYVCGYIDREVEYYDARAVDTLVAGLSSKIAELEARIEALEGGYKKFGISRSTPNRGLRSPRGIQ